MKPGAGAAEKLSQSADADHMDQRAWQRENQIERGAKAQADIDLPVLFAEYQMQMKNRTFVLFFYVLLSLHLL